MLERLVSSLVGLGVPGFILFVLATSSGLAGGAAIVAALAALGPGGLVGGLATAGLLVLIASAVAEYGFPKVLGAVVDGFVEAGFSRQELRNALHKTKPYLKATTFSELLQKLA
jgi:hypothetical protein